jgi:hypothetical protein
MSQWEIAVFGGLLFTVAYSAFAILRVLEGMRADQKAGFADLSMHLQQSKSALQALVARSQSPR